MSWVPLIELAAEIAFLSIDVIVVKAIYKSYDQIENVLESIKVWRWASFWN